MKPTMTTEERTSAYHRYNTQKICTKRRKDVNGQPIEFLLTFDEWVNVWIESGKWEQRGRAKGQYVMARHNDVGPYADGNVYIEEAGRNVSQANVARLTGKPTPMHGRPAWNKGLKGRKGEQQERVVCPHCSKEGGKNLLTRYHFDHCKMKGFETPEASKKI